LAGYLAAAMTEEPYFSSPRERNATIGPNLGAELLDRCDSPKKRWRYGKKDASTVGKSSNILAERPLSPHRTTTLDSPKRKWALAKDQISSENLLAMPDIDFGTEKVSGKDSLPRKWVARINNPIDTEIKKTETPKGPPKRLMEAVASAGETFTTAQLREKVVKEIIDTEKEYVDDLKILLEVISNFFRFCNSF
jgi:hypothetical protein